MGLEIPIFIVDWPRKEIPAELTQLRGHTALLASYISLQNSGLPIEKHILSRQAESKLGVELLAAIEFGFQEGYRGTYNYM